MKWYEYRDQHTKENVWWTQRDANGICWEIRNEPLAKNFRLYKCEKFVSKFGSLTAAMNAAK